MITLGFLRSQMDMYGKKVKMCSDNDLDNDSPSWRSEMVEVYKRNAQRALRNRNNIINKA